jgi:hypothetical protein
MISKSSVWKKELLKILEDDGIYVDQQLKTKILA